MKRSQQSKDLKRISFQILFSKLVFGVTSQAIGKTNEIIESGIYIYKKKRIWITKKITNLEHGVALLLLYCLIMMMILGDLGLLLFYFILHV